MSAVWRLQWRELTPKGAPGRIRIKENLTLDDIEHELYTTLANACWIYIQRDDVDFKGSSVIHRKVKK